MSTREIARAIGDPEFYHLLETIPTGAYTCDPDGLITYFNAHALELWGRAPKLNDPTDRFCGSFKLFATDGTAIPHDDCWMARALRTEQEFNGHEIVIERPDGQRRTVLAHANPIRDQSGSVLGAVNVLVDITDRRHAEDAVRTADRSKTEFLAILAHELRNPLAPATNALHILQMKAPPIPEVQWAREVIATQVQRMTRLIDDLMDVSRITSNKLTLRVERVELAKVVEEALTATRPFIEESGHEMTVTLPREPVYLNADMVRLAQVLSNLLTNAAKYTNPGGRISLRAERQGGEAVITIKDSGIGIQPELLPKIFDMFMQGDRTLTRRYGGLGIGLTLVRRLVEMHGGSVEARSEGKDKGSEFTIRVPAVVDKVNQEPEAATNDGALPHSHRRILVVDDNELSANSLSILLGMAGNETRTAYGGPEALAAAEKFRPHVVLLDLGLPTMDGYETCVRIRQEPWGKDILIVALTGWGQAEDRRRSTEAGFDRHIVKPADPVELMKMVAELEAAKAQGS